MVTGAVSGVWVTGSELLVIEDLLLVRLNAVAVISPQDTAMTPSIYAHTVVKATTKILPVYPKNTFRRPS